MNKWNNKFSTSAPKFEFDNKNNRNNNNNNNMRMNKNNDPSKNARTNFRPYKNNNFRSSNESDKKDEKKIVMIPVTDQPTFVDDSNVSVLQST